MIPIKPEVVACLERRLREEIGAREFRVRQGC
jgi:hypothetical protein